MKQEEENNEQQQPVQNIAAYIFVQNVPVGDEPVISLTFPISIRLFCVTLAFSRLEKQKEQKNAKDD